MIRVDSTHGSPSLHADVTESSEINPEEMAVFNQPVFLLFFSPSSASVFLDRTLDLLFSMGRCPMDTSAIG